MVGWGGKEGEGWGEPRACGCPAPGQWAARTAPPIPFWRDRIGLGPGGCPLRLKWPLLLLLPTAFLFGPESWSHLPYTICKVQVGEPKGTGRTPTLLGPQGEK